MRQNNESKYLLLKEEKQDPRKNLFSDNDENKENNFLNSNIIISNTLLDSVNKLKIVFEQIIKNKEELKTEIQKTYQELQCPNTFF